MGFPSGTDGPIPEGLARANDRVEAQPAPKPRDETPVKDGDRWAFDGQVTAVFDDMLERSIPQYDVMRDAVLDLADRFAKNDTHVVDLGASRGEATARLLDRRGAQLRYSLVETSKPMLEALRERFKSWITNRIVKVHDLDLRTEHPPEAASVVLSVLTLQFVPIEYRHAVVRRAYKKLGPGGAMIVVEKVLGATAEIDSHMTSLYAKKKRASGYSPEEITRKKLSLEGVLVPVTAAWNEQLLASAGFREVDCFWRWQNFAGWLAIKSD